MREILMFSFSSIFYPAHVILTQFREQICRQLLFIAVQ